MFRILFTFSISSSVVFLFMYLYLSPPTYCWRSLSLLLSLKVCIGTIIQAEPMTTWTLSAQAGQNKTSKTMIFFYFSPRPGDV
jgi:hypothetical protein